ncbi:DUF2971 domain-containing protein [Vibrio plantisponsor]|uniref:DUF2971 domain-containing protein n=1 Tax=Vibrio plantisponsor TaxID=664643 RepID=A0ABU4IN04_9VIBR|nr:DUF2971 domain-containing protein [Vibrio plantisponsor]MDW6019955.1 DUF2971 domain-containing protein [Vibrio plantisponsor]NNM42652.1 DUF2971 domain-containing protein [Vibrio plantisponsor]
MTEEEFDRLHPWPDANGVSSLFRFMSINKKRPEILNTLFLEKKLYHSLATDFNDPFECRPHFVLDGKINNAKNIRDYLNRMVRKEYKFTFKQAQQFANETMTKPGCLNDVMKKANDGMLGKLRICCYTTNKENLLFWAHYANSHKGFCIELDATTLPVSYAYKVQYSEEYPLAVYPLPRDRRAFRFSLIKSKAWEYEDEYRTVFLPTAPAQVKLPHDGTSLHMPASTITNVYLGALISDEDKEILLEVIDKSEFNPVIWQASLSESSYNLNFTKLR